MCICNFQIWSLSNFALYTCITLMPSTLLLCQHWYICHHLKCLEMPRISVKMFWGGPPYPPPPLQENLIVWTEHSSLKIKSAFYYKCHAPIHNSLSFDNIFVVAFFFFLLFTFSGKKFVSPNFSAPSYANAIQSRKRRITVSCHPLYTCIHIYEWKTSDLHQRF